MLQLSDIKDYGFNFDAQSPLGFKPNSKDSIKIQLAQDSALITQANAGVPAELLAFIDPKVVEIMTAKRSARALAGETKKGDWTTPYNKWRVDEYVGTSNPYSDFAQGSTSDVNTNWATREQYLFQTTIQYGDYETAVSAVAKVDLASRKQKAAATILDIDYNKFALLGVEGKQIYGLLNDPNLPDAIVANSTGKDDSTKWKDKTTVQVYNDILALFNELAQQSGGLIDYNSPLILALSPEQSVFLGSATDFNVSVTDMLKKNFANLQIVTVPELASMTAGQTVMLFATEVNGSSTAEIAFSIKVQAHRVVPQLSSLEQKWSSSTYGSIVYMPFAFASMTGV